MPAAENKVIARRFFDELLNQHKLAAVNELIATDFVLHSPDRAILVRGPEDLKSYLITLHVAFPDRHVTLEDIFTEEDRVACRWSQTATHRGEYLGVPSTGKRVTFTGITIFRLAGGKIEEMWFNSDTLDLMQQLEVMPTLG
jgi:steroid delta-isomerase-like uncharacterized protein